MLTERWKQSNATMALDDSVRYIERTQGGPLSFRGELEMQLSGNEAVDYLAGEPYHQISVYRTDAEAYAVVIAFFNGERPGMIDAELVSSVGEMDDFFCIHASDLFQNQDVTTSGVSQRHSDVEQRVLARYDVLVVEILKQLRGALNEAAPPVIDRRVQSASSGVDCSTALVAELEGDGGGADE